jgi:hypothetical protein
MLIVFNPELLHLARKHGYFTLITLHARLVSYRLYYITHFNVLSDHWKFLNETLHTPPQMPSLPQLQSNRTERIEPTSLYECQGDQCELELVTYSSSCSLEANEFAERITKANNFNYTFLGIRTQWLGFGHRIRLLKKYLRHVPPEKIILWTDATDVGFLPACTAQIIKDTFRAHRSPILFLAETVCWPDGHRGKEFPVPSQKPDIYRWVFLDITRDSVFYL